MQIYIMRHGEAENFAASDAERSLTARGIEQSQQMATLLASHLNGELDHVWVSPYLRAQQTWQAMVDTLPTATLVGSVEDITPYGDAETVAEYIKATIETEQPQSLLLISHLPLVGYLTAELVAGLQPPMFLTSAIAAIDYDPQTGSSKLLWQHQPHK
ncbi:phosphohistidine phosphatase SixA [Photobacterium phosphoreum]|jgi:phosphohistidine phosphatase|uniref:Phosphohistidine phosphatase SixA n=1 Tax=Photobacterium phosphoreum TaxID=659 RepID=A0AAW4ZTF1_PHOPO|nr:phosphohistidine phosphatase SixA [Photobacterium phosphoreum]KJF88523.1 phosphohistidine phosphatase [Photobacterium phosphoreum]MCD9461883.1 phosphohistidine phosphatase SixA [Photobacterium phosphoreum]MCD9469984.1 phosphohistidine phosphatase SixA [Photobacterium phosphoreum]MCD9473333.1 phosphohistidine phosphatase SixA [Photobacterium phosphoreum]MCD9482433.1 phosphohistidine phosphatase SixA [Photobacterium phosphoreum]